MWQKNRRHRQYLSRRLKEFTKSHASTKAAKTAPRQKPSSTNTAQNLVLDARALGHTRACVRVKHEVSWNAIVEPASTNTVVWQGRTKPRTYQGPPASWCQGLSEIRRQEKEMSIYFNFKSQIYRSIFTENEVNKMGLEAANQLLTRGHSNQSAKLCCFSGDTPL